MKIAVIGTGRIGLLTAAGFADFGHEAICVERDPAAANAVQAGELAFHEPGLRPLVKRHLAAGGLRVTSNVTEALADAPIVFIATGPRGDAAGRVAIGDVLEVAAEVARAIVKFTVIATRDALPLGTVDKICEVVAANTSTPFAVVANPALVEPGRALQGFFKPARVIIGTADERAVALFRQLYRGVMLTEDRTEVMDVRSAELAAVAPGALLATEDAVLAELGRLCGTVGADLEHVRDAIGFDRPRATSLDDLRALHESSRDRATPAAVIDAALRTSERQLRALGARVVAHFGGSLVGKRIAVWGLAVPDTDDIDADGARELFDRLHTAGATAAAYDPLLTAPRASWGAGRIELCTDAYAATSGADALVLLTDARELRQIDLERVRDLMRTRVLFDPHNAWSLHHARAAGFTYYGNGRRG